MAYADVVLADSPWGYWKLDSNLNDSSGNNRALTGAGTVAYTGTAGADGTALILNGTNTRAYQATQVSNPQTFTLECWFQAEPRRGGYLMGFGDGTGDTTWSRDRHLYLTATGQLRFGIWSGSAKTVISPSSYDDGAWHHAVAVYESNDLYLYVDGSLAASSMDVGAAENYSGYWRIGANALGSWPDDPGFTFFGGLIDEVAVYTTGLSDVRVAAHYAAATPTYLDLRRASTAGLLAFGGDSDQRRVSTAGLLAFDSTAWRRVSQAGLLAFSGPSLRRVSQAGLNVFVPALGPDAPDVVNLIGWNQGAVTIETEPYSGHYAHAATHYRVRRADNLSVVYQVRVTAPDELIFHRLPLGTLAYETQYLVDAQHEDELALYSGWGTAAEFLTPAWIEPPDRPVIAATVSGPDTIRVTTAIPGEDALDHELYMGEAADDLTLYAASLGPTPLPVWVSGLVMSRRYYFQLKAITLDEELWSNVAALSIEPLALVASAVAGETATLRITNAGDAYECNIVTTTDADTGFLAPIDDHYATGLERDTRYLTGLEFETTYRARARVRWVDGGPWSAWTPVTTFTTYHEAYFTPGGNFTAPEFGEPVSGLFCYELDLDPGRSVVTIEISGDYGQTWTTLPGLCVDVTDWTCGVYILRVTLDDGTVLQHPGVVVGAGTEYQWFSCIDGVTLDEYWSPDLQLRRWTCATACYGGHAGHMAEHDAAAFGYTVPEPEVANRQIVVGTGYIWTTGGGNKWMQFWPAEGADVGIVAWLQGRDQPGDERLGICLTVSTWLMGHAYAPVEEAGLGIGTLHLSIGSISVTQSDYNGWPGLGWSVDIPVAASFTSVMTQDTPGNWVVHNCGLRPYQLLLEVSRPQPLSHPERLTVYGRCQLYSPYYRGMYTVAEIGPYTVDVTDPDTGEPYVWPAGPAAALTRKIPGFMSDGGVQTVIGFGTWEPTCESPFAPPCPFDVCEPVSVTNFGVCEPVTATGFDKCQVIGETVLQACHPPPDLC